MPSVGSYIDALHQAWTQRAERGSVRTVQVEVAGWRVQIDATPELIATVFAGAFDPPGGPDCAPDLHVRVAAGDPPPTPRGAGWGEHDRLHFHDDRFEIHVAPGAALSVIDHVDGRAICWFPDAELPYWECGAPLRTVLAWFALRRSALLVHAAAVAANGKAALLVGSGGAGKTTTALAAWNGGMDYLGDDYVFARIGAEITTARAYATAKVDAHTLTLLPHLARLQADTATGPDGVHADKDADKVVLQLGGAPGLDVVEATVVAIVVPYVRAGPTMRALSPGDALRAAAPSALFQLPYDRTVAFPLLAEIVRRAPCFVLETGSDPMRAAAMVREVVQNA